MPDIVGFIDEPEEVTVTEPDIVGFVDEPQPSMRDQALVKRGVDPMHIDQVDTAFRGDVESNYYLEQGDMFNAVTKAYPNADVDSVRNAIDYLEGLRKRGEIDEEQERSERDRIMFLQSGEANNVTKEELSKLMGHEFGRQLVRKNEDGEYELPVMRHWMGDRDRAVLISGQEEALLAVEDYYRSMYGSTFDKTLDAASRGTVEAARSLWSGVKQMPVASFDMMASAADRITDASPNTMFGNSLDVPLSLFRDEATRNTVRDWLFGEDDISARRKLREGFAQARAEFGNDLTGNTAAFDDKVAGDIAQWLAARDGGNVGGVDALRVRGGRSMPKKPTAEDIEVTAQALKEMQESFEAYKPDDIVASSQMAKELDRRIASTGNRAVPDSGATGFYYDVVQATPNFLMQVLATAITKRPMAGMGLVGTSVFGGEYDRLLDAGVSQENAQGGAALSALVQMGLSAIPNRAYADLFLRLPSDMKAGLGRAIMRTAGTCVGNALKEAPEEFLQTFSGETIALFTQGIDAGEDLGDMWVAYTESLPETLKQSAYSGLVGGTLGFFSGLGRVKSEVQHDSLVKKRATAFDDMGSRLLSTKLAKDAPHLASDFAQDLAGPDAKVRIDGETFFQALNEFDPETRRETKELLGLTDDQVNEAMREGGEVEMRWGDGLVLPQDVKARILNDLRIGSTASVNELADIKHLTKEYRKAAMEVMGEEVATIGKVQEVRQQILDLNHPGLTADYADAVAAVLTARARIAALDWSSATGETMTASEWINSINPRIVAGGDGGVTMILDNVREAAQMQDAPQSPRGSVTFNDGESIIQIFKKGDRSTILHELGHVFMKDMESLAQSDQAPADVVRDFNILRTRFGIDGKIDKAGHESIAKAFEAYLQSGKAPSPDLAPVFNRLKNWLGRIYNAIAGTSLLDELDEEVQGVFDRMFATQSEIDAVSEAYSITDALIKAEAANSIPSKSKSKVRGAIKDFKEHAEAKQVEVLAKAHLRAIGGRAAVRAEVKERLEAMPIYQAIKKARQEGGLSLDDITFIMREIDPGVVNAIVENHGQTIVPVKVREFVLKNADAIAAMMDDGDGYFSKDVFDSLAREVMSQTEDVGELTKWAGEVQRTIKDLERRLNEQNVTRRTKGYEGLFDAAEDMFDTSESGLVYQIRKALPEKVKFPDGKLYPLITKGEFILDSEKARSLSMEERITMRDSLANIVLDKIRGFDDSGYGITSNFEHRADELLDAAIELGSRKQADDARAAYIQGAAQDAFDSDLSNGIESLSDYLNSVDQRIEYLNSSEFLPLIGESVRGDGRLRIAEVAKEFGFDTPEAMLMAMADAKPFTKAVTEITDARLEDVKQEIRADIESSEVVASDKGVATKIAEAKLIEEAIEANGRKLERKAKHVAMKLAVEQAMSSKKLKDAKKYSTYLNRAKTLARRSIEAMQKNDLEQAYELKNQEIMQLMLANESVKNREYVAKAERRMRAIANANPKESVSWEYVENVKRILTKHGIIKDAKIRDDTPPLSEVMLTADAEGLSVADVVDAEIINPTTENYRDLTMEQFRALNDTVVMLAEMGSDTLHALKSGDAERVADWADSIRETVETLNDKRVIQEHESGLLHTLQTKYDSASAEIMQVHHLLSAMDAWSDINDGAFGKATQIRLALAEARADMDRHRNEIDTKLNSIFRERIMPEIDRIIQRYSGRKFFDVDGLPLPDSMRKVGKEKMTPEMLVAAALNLGNMGNLAALAEGYGWVQSDLEKGADAQDADLMAVRDRIASEFSSDALIAIQEIGNIIGGMYEGLNQSHLQMYHVPMAQRVMPDAFSVRAADGKTVDLDGWYYPIHLDHKIDQKAAKLKEADLARNAMKAVHNLGKPKSSFTEARKGTKRPVRLDMSVITQHIDASLRFQHMMPVVNEAAKIFQNKELRGALVDKFGQAKVDQLLPWLTTFIRGYDYSDMTTFDKALKWHRAAATVSVLGLNFLTGIKQRFSLFTAAGELGGGGVKHLAKATWQLGWRNFVYGEHGRKIKSDTLQMIHDLDPSMAGRNTRYNREMYDIAKDMKPYQKRYKMLGGKSWSEVVDSMFVFLAANDLATTNAVWLASYNKVMSGDHSGLEPTEENAVNYARMIVENTQPSGLPEHLSAFQRSQGVVRNLTMFATFTMLQGNLVRKHRAAYKAGKISREDYYRYMVTDVGMNILALTATGILAGGKEEWGEWGEELAHNAVGTPLSWVPIARDIHGYFRYNRDLGTMSSFGGINQTLKAVRTGAEATGIIESDKDAKDFIWEASRAAEFYLRVPAIKLYERTVRDYENMKNWFVEE